MWVGEWVVDGGWDWVWGEGGRRKEGGRRRRRRGEEIEERMLD